MLPSAHGQLTKHGKGLPLAQIYVVDAHIIQGYTPCALVNLVVSATINDEKLVTCTFDVEVDHRGTRSRARRLSSVVDYLLHIKSQLDIATCILVLDVVDHALVSVILRSDQPQIIEFLIIPVLPSEHVESFFELFAFGCLFL